MACRVSGPESLPHAGVRPPHDVRPHHRPHRCGAGRGDHRLQHGAPRRLAHDGRNHTQRHGARDPCHLRNRADADIRGRSQNQHTLAKRRERRRRYRDIRAQRGAYTRSGIQPDHSRLAGRTGPAYAPAPHRPPRRQAFRPACAQLKLGIVEGHGAELAETGTAGGLGRRRDHGGNRALRPEHRHGHPQHHRGARHHPGGGWHAPQGYRHRLVPRSETRRTAQRHQPHGSHIAVLHPRQYRNAHYGLPARKGPLRDRFHSVGALGGLAGAGDRLPRDILRHSRTAPPAARTHPP